MHRRGAAHPHRELVCSKHLTCANQMQCTHLLFSFLHSVGHKGKFGHEFMEFEFRPNGRMRYANNSNYKNDVMIRKEGGLC